LEVLFWHFRGQSVPVSGISGGEWALVVLVALAGSGLFFASRASSRWPHVNFGVHGADVFGETFDYPVSGDHGTGKTPHVIVENWRGNARIVGADDAAVKVTGRKTVRAMRQEEADRANSMSPFEITQNGDQLVIRTNQDRATGDQRISSDLEITVPRGASIEARGRYGDFDISGVTGKVEVNSDNAGVRVQDIGSDLRVDLRRSDIVRATGVKGSVDVKAAKGQDIEIENIAGPVSVEGSYSGEVQFRNLAKALKYQTDKTELHVEKVSGDLRLALGDLTGANITGPLRLNANRSCDVDLSNYTESAEITLERGDVVLRPAKGGLGKTDVKVRSGNIEMALPQGVRFELAAKTDHGSVENDYGDILKVENTNHGGSISGRTGNGPMLRLNTDRGEVHVRRSNGEEVSAAKPEPEDAPEAPAPPAAPRKPKTEIQ
jgi:DUF4097 and DUF4098 domain-containing protein YvlB